VNDDLPRRVGAHLRSLLPRSSDYEGAARSWRHDILAGVTVGVVALPLALGFGVASGVSAAAGLITAIVAGFVAAIFGGSHVQVTGPTGAMAVVLLPIVHHYGVAAVPLVGCIAGVILVGASLLGAGRTLSYVPWPVIEGFTVGIAVVISLQQVPNALGVTAPKGSSTVLNAVHSVTTWLSSPSWAPLVITVATIALIELLRRVRRSLPSSLLAVLIVTCTTLWVVHVARIGTLPSSVGSLKWPSEWSETSQLLGAALAVAILAGLESLLSARVADGLADHGSYQPNRELFGQGLANMACSLFGGVPATGAIARTAVNVRAGARTRLSAISHSVILLVVLLFAGSLVARIPMAVLAAVLISTAFHMVDRHDVRSVITSTRGDAFIFIVSATLTVAVNLITAVEVGIVLAALLALTAISRSSGVEQDVSVVDRNESRDAQLLREKVVVFRLEGALFFGATQRFFREMTAADGIKVAILRMPQLQYLDATGARALGELVEDLGDQSVAVFLKGLRPEHERVVRSVASLQRIIDEGHAFSNLDEAIGHAREHIAA